MSVRNGGARRRRAAVLALPLLAVIAVGAALGGYAPTPLPAAGPAGPDGRPSPAGPDGRPSPAGSQPPAPASAIVAQHIVDVAVLRSRPDEPPRLLTVAQDDTSPGRVRLAVLERAHAGRWTETSATVDEPRSPGQTRTPWLVALDGDRFVLLTVAPARAETWLRTVTWAGDRVELGPRATVGRPADAAGATDVDADGEPELVLAEARTTRRGGLCQGSQLVVVDLPSLEPIAEHLVPNVRLDAGAVGELDATPGADLVAASYRNCPAGPASAARLMLVSIRLRDGALLDERRLVAGDPLAASSGRPAVLDVDGDGDVEVLLGGEQLLVLEPRREWQVTAIEGAPAVLLGAVSRPHAADVAVLDEAGLAAVRVRWDGDGWQATELGRVDATTTDLARIEGATIDARSAAIRRGGGAGWLDGPAACPDLVVSLAVLRCADDDPLVAGPAWLATRPVARLAGADRLLVAQTDVWTSVPPRLVAPSPLAAERADDHWRHGPSETFSLVEVSLDAMSGAAQPPPAPDPFASLPGPSLSVAAAAGSRLVASLAAIESRATTDTAAKLARLMAVPRRSGSSLSFVRVPDAGKLDLRLPSGVAGTASSWSVEIASIGPLGDVSPVVRAEVAVDTTAPVLTVEDAWVRPPWPLTSTLSGTTEPGATVRISGGSTVASSDGRFTLPVRLAPWPQRVEVRAADSAGNERPLVADVVGGPDLRRLPWVPILAATLLVGAALGGLGRRRDAAEAPLDGPSIEEIDARSVR